MSTYLYHFTKLQNKQRETYKPGSVLHVVIYLELLLPATSSVQPKNVCRSGQFFYSDLLQVGFTLPVLLPNQR